MSAPGADSAPTPQHPAVLDDAELAASSCFDRDVPVVPEVAPRDPRAVLEEEVLRGLQQSPCMVSFSGGCDSSAVLALAVHIARREGLPEPIPVTRRYPHGHPDDNEDAWQEFVIGELRVSDWERIEIREHEIIGEDAERLCARHGVLWPPFFHSFEPTLARASGGALLTGEYGDDVQTPWEGAAVLDVLSPGRRPAPRALGAAVGRAAPRSLRRAMSRRRQPERPWLCESLREAVREGLARDESLVPWRADVARRQMPFRRHAAVWDQNMALVAGTDVALIHPFARQELFEWVAHRYGVRGPTKRSDVLAAWFGDCLPTTVLERKTRVSFGDVYWGEACRSFARSWEPRWWPSHLVDPEALRATWLADGFLTGTWTLMQLAWWSTRCEHGDPPRTLGEIARARPRAHDSPRR